MSDEKESILEGRGAYERYKEVKDKGLLLFEGVVGSTAYGTNLPTSDVDKKFIYLETLENILAGTASLQINITDDYVGYELGRYLGLLRTQNPNIIELVNSDPQHVEFCHPLFRDLVLSRKDEFLTNKVAFSFGEYARSQIKKAQGTNKKFMNPMDKEKQTVFEFMWVGEGQGSVSLKDWMQTFRLKNGPNMEYADWFWGCVAIDHMKNTYHLFFDRVSWSIFNEDRDEVKRDKLWAMRPFNGIVGSDGNNIKLSSVPKESRPVCTFYFNLEGWQKYNKDYQSYWEWVDKRNPQRFVENSEPDVNYDRKNMMHCHRLLDMCIEILKGEGVKVLRPNREELLAIRLGHSTYQELVDKAEEKYALIQELYKTTSLPGECDRSIMRSIILEFRLKFYGITTS